MSILREWLKNTYEITEGGYLKVRPRIVCKDGFSMSVQAGYYLYSTPRANLESGNYTEVEIGFPSEKEDLICGFAEDHSDYTETVYPYVPIEIVENVIQKHGGMSTGECENK